MARIFPDFVDSYLEYARDGFCPDHFHEWIGISLIAATLERRVSIKQGNVYHYPNLYVMLVSHPGVGKSTAITRGVGLLEQMEKLTKKEIRIIPNQATEAALIEEMKYVDYFEIKTPTGITQVPQTAAFFHADEASSSALQNVYGNFVNTMTALYDCPKWFRKTTKGDGKTEIENACMNMLAGSTFNYLRELVNEKSVLGGFASRLLYVVSKDRPIRDGAWEFQGETNFDMFGDLVKDLAEVRKLAGPFKVEESFKEAYQYWRPKFDQELHEMDSEKMESINARKMTNLIKLAMVFSASESSEMKVTGEHFERARKVIERVTEDNALIIQRALVDQKDSQEGLIEAIRMFVGEMNGSGMEERQLKMKLLESGFDAQKVGSTIDVLKNAGMLGALNGRVWLPSDTKS